MQPDILTRLPHQGAMCLLASVLRWDAESITCHALSHRDPDNPLRHRGRLGPVCGIEYGLQAAALHGALRDGAPQKPGYLASLREVEIAPGLRDLAALGALRVDAWLERRESGGLIYRFAVGEEGMPPALRGRAVIALPAVPA